LDKKYHTFKQNVIHFNYKAFKYNDGELLLGQIKINTMTISNLNLQSVIKHYEHGHKITCLINDTYLSRAQVCDTQESDRNYTWYSGQPSAFGFLSPRGKTIDCVKEDNYDLYLIKMADPSGTNRKRTVHLEPFLPDIDTYSNNVYKLPLELKEGERAHVRVYNFRFTPPKCVETIFQWKEFVPSNALSQSIKSNKGLFRGYKPVNVSPKNLEQTGMVQRTLIDNLVLSIMFIKNEQKVTLVSVRVAAKKFEETLKMDTIQKLVTF
jgi:hypothetical protein